MIEKPNDILLHPGMEQKISFALDHKIDKAVSDTKFTEINSPYSEWAQVQWQLIRLHPQHKHNYIMYLCAFGRSS